MTQPVFDVRFHYTAYSQYSLAGNYVLPMLGVPFLDTEAIFK